MEDLKAKVCKSQWGEDRIPSFYSGDLKDIIRGLLMTDPKDRPKPAQLLRLPRLMGCICLFVGGFSIPGLVGENPAQGAILQHLQALSEGHLPPPIDISALVSPIEGNKRELKQELKALHEATKAPDCATLRQMWNEIHDLERRVEIQECIMQLLNLLIKWVSDSTSIELSLPPEPSVPPIDAHVPILSRPPPTRCDDHVRGLAETISLEGEVPVSDVVCNDRPLDLPSPRRWINDNDIHVNASSELQEVPALQPWRSAVPPAPRTRTEARFSDSESETDMSDLHTDRSGQPRIRHKLRKQILHNEELRPVDVPCSPGALGQLLKDFECESGDARHGGQVLLPVDAIPASPLKALLKHHFNGTNCHTQV